MRQDRRLSGYLAKVEERFERSRADPASLQGMPKEHGPTLEKDEARAEALGRLEEFQLEALMRTMELEDEEVSRQDQERGVDRRENALARLGCWAVRKPLDLSPPQMPKGAAGGFVEHARRESALAEARRHIAAQRGGPGQHSPFELA